MFIKPSYERQLLSLASPFKLVMGRGIVIDSLEKEIFNNLNFNIMDFLKKGNNKSKRVYSIESLLDEIDGVDLVSGENYEKNCFSYIFENESWFKELILEHSNPNEGVLDVLHNKLNVISHGYKFLTSEQGYKKIDDLCKGDVLVYSEGDPNLNNCTHYGVFDGNRVISKFGKFWVLKHPIEKVRLDYGDTVTFLRKS